MFKSRSTSIRDRLLTALLLAVALPLGLLLFVLGRNLNNVVAEGEVDRIAAVNTELAHQVERGMAVAVRALKSLQNNPFLVDPSATAEERRAEMERLVTVYDMFSDISVYDLSGDILDTTSGDHSQILEHTSWFERALTGEICVSAPEIVRGEEGLHLTVYLKAVGSEDAPPQVIKGRLPFDGVWELLDGVKVGEGGFVVLLDSFGNVLAHPDRDAIYTKFDHSIDPTTWFSAPEGEYIAPDGTVYLYAAGVLTEEHTRVGKPWAFVSFLPQAEVAAVVWSSAMAIIPLAFFALALAVVTALFIARRLSSPIVAASEAAKLVAEGDLEARISLAASESDELNLLADAFNDMVEKVAGHRGQLESEVATKTASLQESQRELRELMAQLRAAYESTREAILVLDSSGKVTAANGRFLEFFGVAEAEVSQMDAGQLRERIEDCLEDPEPISRLWTAAEEDGRVEEGTLEIVRPTERFLAVYTAPVRANSGREIAQLWMFTDNTEQRQLQRGLEQAQKMEAVGQLAGGIAHDFNNLLTGIIGNLSLAQMECLGGRSADEDDEIDRRLTSARLAAERGADLVSGLLGFSRQSHLQLATCNVNSIVGEVRDLAFATFDRKITIETGCPEDLWEVEVDPTQVEQVLMNLAVNAKDAMPVGGTLSIHTCNVQLSPAEAISRGQEDGIGGDFVQIVVSDTGTGIPPEVQDKIFEPFFTTKEQGKGTGLGLATSYGLIQQHGGWITCESEFGSGTTFSIYFPRAVEVLEVPSGEDDMEGADNTEETVVPEAQPIGEVATGGEILLVDDDLVVRSVAESLLTRQGFEVVSASDGVEAMEFLEAPGGKSRFALVMLDLTMPRMGGAEVFREMRSSGVTTPVVICSGYLLDFDDFAEETGARPEAFIQKPYQIDEFFAVASRVINLSTAPA